MQVPAKAGQMRDLSSFCAVLLMASMLVLTASASKATRSSSAGNKPKGPAMHFTLPKVDVPRTYGDISFEEWSKFKTAAVQSASATTIRSDTTAAPRNRRMLTQLSEELIYHGGPVMVGTVNVYMIYVMNQDAVWGPDAWHWTQGPDYLVSNLAGSSRWNINTLYYDSSDNFVSGDIVLAHTAHVKVASGISFLNNTEVQRFVELTLSKGWLPVDSDNGIYVVAVAPNTGADMDPLYCASPDVEGNFCAYHTWQFSDLYGGLKLAFVPVSGGSECPDSCSVNASWYPTPSLSPTGSNQYDRFLSDIVHELEETVTDPLLGIRPGWRTSSGDESADLCNTNYGNVSTFINDKGERVAYNSIIGTQPLMLQAGYNIDTLQCVNQL